MTSLELSKKIRRAVLKMIARAGSSHIGSCLSCADLVAVAEHTLKSMQWFAISTGISVEVPPGFEKPPAQTPLVGLENPVGVDLPTVKLPKSAALPAVVVLKYPITSDLAGAS